MSALLEAHAHDIATLLAFARSYRLRPSAAGRLTPFPPPLRLDR